MIQDGFKYSNEVDVMSILKYWSVDFCYMRTMQPYV